MPIWVMHGAASGGPAPTQVGDYTTGLIHRWPMNDANVSGTTITDTVGAINGAQFNEAKRAAAINELIAAHQKALAEFAWLKRTRLN
jgi:hypothetical protein